LFFFLDFGLYSQKGWPLKNLLGGSKEGNTPPQKVGGFFPPNQSFGFFFWLRDFFSLFKKPQEKKKEAPQICQRFFFGFFQKFRGGKKGGPPPQDSKKKNFFFFFGKGPNVGKKEKKGRGKFGFFSGLFQKKFVFFLYSFVERGFHPSFNDGGTLVKFFNSL